MKELEREINYLIKTDKIIMRLIRWSDEKMVSCKEMAVGLDDLAKVIATHIKKEYVRKDEVFATVEQIEASGYVKLSDVTIDEEKVAQLIGDTLPQQWHYSDYEDYGYGYEDLPDHLKKMLLDSAHALSSADILKIKEPTNQ